MRLIILIISMVLAFPTQGEEIPCFSCKIRIDRLDGPFSLIGGWLFTRDDRLENKDPATDTSDWKIVKAPGPWKHVYPDQKLFYVGWYRGNFEFEKSLIGEKVNLLLDTYMGEFTVYLDGEEIFRRDSQDLSKPFLGVQPVFVPFEITKENHVIAIRIDTLLMAGVYQVPFDLIKTSDIGFLEIAYQFLGCDFRIYTGMIVFAFGLFFLLIYFYARSSMYLITALAAFTTTIFALVASDTIVQILGAKKTVTLHYIGMYTSLYFYFIFVQHFDRFWKKTNWVLGVAGAIVTIFLMWSAFVSFNFEYYTHIVLFSKILANVEAWLGAYISLKKLKFRDVDSKILFFSYCFSGFAGFQGMLVVLGKVNQVLLLFPAAMILAIEVLWVTSKVFANTFVQNRNLVLELKSINENLETIVKNRTEELRQKTADLQIMLQTMNLGVCTIDGDFHIHPEYSRFMTEIFHRSSLSGEDVVKLVCDSGNIQGDQRAMVANCLGAIIGESPFCFDFNKHILPRKIETAEPVQYLELDWQPIVNNDLTEKMLLIVRDATEMNILRSTEISQKAELEMIGKIIQVDNENFVHFCNASTRQLKDILSMLAVKSKLSDEEHRLVMRVLHTVKGNARTYGFNNIMDQAHAAEGVVSEKHGADDDQDSSRLRIEAVEKVYSAVMEYQNLFYTKLCRSDSGSEKKAAIYDIVAKKLPEKLEPNKVYVQEMNMIINAFGCLDYYGLSEILDNIRKSLPNLAKALDKPVPEFKIGQSPVLFHLDIYQTLIDVFMHCTRNSMDHGIEMPNERAALKKKIYGLISIEVCSDENNAYISIEDDGRGLNLKAIAKISNLSEDLDDMVIAQNIFKSGVSTSLKVTDISGRGVGMDAVCSFLRDKGCDIAIEFTKPRNREGFRQMRFVITIPNRYTYQMLI